MKKWIIVVFISLCLALTYCDDVSDVSNQNNNIVLKTDSDNINKAKILEQAKLFLHLYYGREACSYYNNPKAPPELSYYAEAETWNVFFNHPMRGMNIEVSADAKRANYHFLNGMVLKKNDGDEVSQTNLPLYTPVEMIELFNTPHQAKQE